MIRRLQRQFVAIAMISLLFIIVAIVGAINGFNLRQINSTADAILELLARNGLFRSMWENYQTSVQWKVEKEAQGV